MRKIAIPCDVRACVSVCDEQIPTGGWYTKSMEWLWQLANNFIVFIVVYRQARLSFSCTVRRLYGLVLLARSNCFCLSVKVEHTIRHTVTQFEHFTRFINRFFIKMAKLSLPNPTIHRCRRLCTAFSTPFSTDLSRKPNAKRIIWKTFSLREAK